jgi:hypothetical protein
MSPRQLAISPTPLGTTSPASALPAPRSRRPGQRSSQWASAASPRRRCLAARSCSPTTAFTTATASTVLQRRPRALAVAGVVHLTLSSTATYIEGLFLSSASSRPSTTRWTLSPSRGRCTLDHPVQLATSTQDHPRH